MRSDYMKPENYNRLFVFMSYENVLAVRVSLETGLRIGDVLKVRPSELRGRTIFFSAEKTGKSGKAVISQDLANRLRQIAGTDYIFEGRGGSGHRSRQAVWKDVKKAAAQLRAAGAISGENITPHSARKTFAVTDAERYGLNHTQKQLQHRDKATTRAYAFSDRYVQGIQDGITLKSILALLSGISERLADLEQKINDFTV